MKFQRNSRKKPIDYERELTKYWADNGIFRKSVEARPASSSYVFYDGPPFITGVPHYGTLLSSIVKDAVPRYQTMKGKRVERVWGWDCHGLPAEVFTEKKLGIKDKRDIGTKISLEHYVLTCRENMIQTGDAWEETIDRIGRWVDFKGAYRTMDKNYMESVWWAFKQLYEAGKIYEGEKVLLYCTRDGTPISKAEEAMDNSYQDVTDPSVFVRFKLTDEDKFILAWTTTPWTLPANSALAINKNEDYVEVVVNGEKFILADHLIQDVLVDEQHNPLDYSIVRKFKGEELVGKTYDPILPGEKVSAYKIWHADYVKLEEGTGVVHLAPAYGEEDYDLAKREGIAVKAIVDDSGQYASGEWQGQQVWEANKSIAKELKDRGIVWRIEYVKHSYPHCFRCGTKLIYRAHPSWFLDVEGQRKLMLDENQTINWFPVHIKGGRFKNTIESAPDWNLSRDRFWATAMPVWKGVDSGGREHIKVIGSYQELKELSGVELEDYHRPWIDEVTFSIDGVEYRRIDKVMDCWFESGSMPFAQFHYPFENKDKFEDNFPGDFIAEYVGQVRAWFYYLTAVSTGIFGAKAFKNVIVTGTLAGNDGRKMSKQYGNFTDPNLLIDQYSADALRFLLLSSPVLNGEDFSLVDKDVADVSRKLNMIWNMYDFFSLYASVDDWEWRGDLNDPLAALSNPLDRWIVSRLHALGMNIETSTDSYDLPRALKPVAEFIDDASNWYVRRSRRRFWKSDNDTDKADAYRTLHYVLAKLAIYLAPFTPFLSEELYRLLTGDESVHLLDWPEQGTVDDAIVEQMSIARDLIARGLAVRAEKGIKARQPLAKVSLNSDRNLSDELLLIIKDELNVKEIELSVLPMVAQEERSVELDTIITPQLRKEGLIRELVRHIQSVRKQASLEVEDRISLLIESDSPEITEAVEEFDHVIRNETLTEVIGDVPADAFTSNVKVEGLAVSISVSKFIV